MWSVKSNGEDRNEPTPKSDYATRVNEVFEETQYSPSSNPFGHRPDQRTSAGAQAARKRLSLEGETLHADGNNNGGGRSNDTVQGALQDAGLKFSSVENTLKDAPSIPAAATRNAAPREQDSWNLAAENPIFSATPRGERNTPGGTPHKNAPLSPESTKSTPRSSLPGSAQKVEADVFPKSFPVSTEEASGSLPGGLAGWVRRQREFSTRMSRSAPGAIGRGPDGRGVVTHGNLIETAKAMFACFIFLLLILGITSLPGKPATPSLTPEEYVKYLKSVGRYDGNERPAVPSPDALFEASKRERERAAAKAAAARNPVAPPLPSPAPAAVEKPAPKLAQPLPTPQEKKSAHLPKHQKSPTKPPQADGTKVQSIVSKIKTIGTIKSPPPPLPPKKSFFQIIVSSLNTQTAIVFASITAVTALVAFALRAMQSIALAAAKPVVVAPTSTPLVGGRTRSRIATESVSPSRSRSASRGRSSSRPRSKKASLASRKKKAGATKAAVASSPRTPRSAAKRLSSMEQQIVNEPVPSVRRGRSSTKKWNRE